MALTKKELLEELKLKTTTVQLASGSVNMTEISASEYLEIYNSDAVKDSSGEFDGNRFTALLVGRCVVDAKGKRLFNDEECHELSGGSSAVYTKLAQAAKELNGIGLTPKN